MTQDKKSKGCLGVLLEIILGLVSFGFKVAVKLIRFIYDFLFAGFKFSQIQNKSGFVLFWITATLFCSLGAVLAAGARSNTPPSEPTPIITTVEVTRQIEVEITRIVERIVTVTFTPTPLASPTITPTPTITATPTRTLRPSRTPTKTPTPLPSYVSLVGNIWSGVKVYYGANSKKTYGFEILGGSTRCQSISSGVLVQYPGGAQEWKDRSYLTTSGLFFVLDNDRAIARAEWQSYLGCP